MREENSTAERLSAGLKLHVFLSEMLCLCSQACNAYIATALSHVAQVQSFASSICWSTAVARQLELARLPKFLQAVAR